MLGWKERQTDVDGWVDSADTDVWEGRLTEVRCQLRNQPGAVLYIRFNSIARTTLRLL